MITVEIAEKLKYRATLVHVSKKDSRGNPVKCRVSGRCQLWKRRPTAFKLPVKYGLNHSFYITESNAGEWQVETA